MNNHENIVIDIEVGDKLYEVTIVQIDEIVEHPDGGGDIPIVYQTLPPVDDEATDKAIRESLIGFMHRAINNAIEEARRTEHDKTDSD